MPAPLAPGLRAAILEDLRRRDGRSARVIGKAHGVSDATVRRIANQEGIDDAWSRDKTKKATEAAVADARAIRAATSRRFLDETNLLLDQLHQPHTAFNFGGKDNTYEEHEFPEPPVDAKRTLITAAAIAYDKHLAQERHDAVENQDMSSVDSWLEAMVDGAGH
jgi:hypothetical protein